MPRPTQFKYNYFNIKGHINSFTEEYEIFDENYNCEFIYFGDKWNSVLEAYKAKVEDNFTKSQKLKLMGNILYSFYLQNDKAAAILLSTKEMWLEKKVKNHDNFWHSCNCADCFFDSGNNYYGKLLMEIRDYLIWKNKRTVGRKAWESKYL